MTLDELALKHGTDKASSHHDYCRIYEPLFERRRHEAIDVMEVGVYGGASINLWLEYFDAAQIYAVDIVNGFQSDNPRFHFIQGNQGSRVFWSRLDPLLYFDLVIDDGSHYTYDVVTTFEHLWNRLREGGLYIIEDCFTFYHKFYRKTNFGPEWFQSFIDAANMGGKAFYGYPGDSVPNRPLTDLEEQVEWVQFHKGLVIIKKRTGKPNLL